MIHKETPLSVVAQIGKECTQCGHCCRTGSGFAIDDDLPRIAQHLQISEQQLKDEYFDAVEQFHTTLHRPKLRSSPVGECIFLKENKCSIHEVKPLQCKTGNLFAKSAQLRAWFALNYQVNTSDPQSIREWSMYLQTGGVTIPGGELADLVPNEKQLQKILNYEVL